MNASFILKHNNRCVSNALCTFNFSDLTHQLWISWSPALCFRVALNKFGDYVLKHISEWSAVFWKRRHPYKKLLLFIWRHLCCLGCGSHKFELTGSGRNCRHNYLKIISLLFIGFLRSEEIEIWNSTNGLPFEVKNWSVVEISTPNTCNTSNRKSSKTWARAKEIANSTKKLLLWGRKLTSIAYI